HAESGRTPWREKSFPPSESYFLDRAGSEPLQVTCWALIHLFQLQLQSHPLTLYHLDGAALARCTALIDDRGAAATAVERMATRLLAAVFRPNVAECTKGRFFDRASDKLSQLARFATNELVSIDLQAMASARTYGRSHQTGRRITNRPEADLSARLRAVNVYN